MNLLATPGEIEITTNAPVQRLIDEHFAHHSGHLVMGGVRVDDLVAAYGSPLFIYDRAVIERKLSQLKQAFTSRVDIYYSMKANPNQAILRYFVSQGCGLEVASLGELEQALAAGCPARKILFAGPGKRDEELRRAVELEVSEIHVESLAEAKRLDRIAANQQRLVRVGLRINPVEAVQGGAMRMGGKPAPFGIDEECLETTLDAMVELSSLRISGIHLYSGTQILDDEILIRQYEKALDLGRQVAVRLDTPLASIDFGGGLGIPYFERETPLDLHRFAPQFQRLLATVAADPWLANARLIVEPGRFLVGESGLYVSRVLDIKRSRGKTFAVLDGGMHHHLAASGNLGQTIKRNYPIAVLNRLDAPCTQRMELVGPLCTPLDVLGRDLLLPELAVGDLIGVFQSGAYGRTSSPLEFLSHPTPAEVMVDTGQHQLIRRSGELHDWLHNQFGCHA